MKIDNKVMGTVLIFLCGIAIFLFFFNSKKIILSKNYKVYYRGQSYLYLGEYDKAIREYEKIKTGNLRDKRKLLALKNLKLAESYSLKGDVENSQKYIKYAKETKNRDIEVLNSIIFNEFINGKFQEALTFGEAALNDNKYNKELIKTMVSVYMVNDKKNEVIKIIESYKVDKTSSYDMAQYAGMLMNIGKTDEAMLYLQEAWNLDKDEYKIYDVLAQASIYDKELIINSIKKFQKTNLTSIAPMMWMAKIYSLNEETCKKSEELIKELKNKEIGNLQLSLIEAMTLQKLNKQDEAEYIINEMVKNNGNDYRVLHTAGWFYLYKNQLDDAEKYCINSINKNKKYVDNYAFLMPEILKKKDKTIGLPAYYREALSKEPYNFSIINSISNYYLHTVSKPKEAMKFLKISSKIRPLDSEIKYNMALIYFNSEKGKEAENILKECIKLDDNSVKYHRTLGAVYLSLGKPNEAITEMQKAFKLDKDDILNLNNTACYYIMYTNNFNKGYYNLNQALSSINSNTSEYTKKVIKDNLENIKSIIKKIEEGKGNESIKIPDFRLLY
ncbi:hypothetical protein RBU49_00775 [Clostridium sp. MB40-C1]|uniref:tetratricopeptide repeat protein n=1 Tax=Clostridium sp. MB40-C1 TaxID=3070996 RepID=UPI0027E035D9|nr:tetratricopeptide repeat protein [Clostridium sp. MB40-C1]WMJ80811.1 hypothetical protein RBU49_00775 [Clostridium sp. MB40-C1]